MKGWIKLNHDFVQWQYYQDNNVKVVLIHLLLMANIFDTKYMGMIVPRGSLITKIESRKGNATLSSAVNLTHDETKTALQKLKKSGCITTKATNKFTLIHIVNYDKYQDNTSEYPRQDKELSPSQSRNNARPIPDLLPSVDIRSKELKNSRIKEKKKKEVKDLKDDDAPTHLHTAEDKEKTSYGEFGNVLLTDKEFKKLVESMGELQTNDYIDRLGAYIASTGRDKGKNAYKSHYATMINWIRKDNGKAKPKPVSTGNPFFTYAAELAQDDITTNNEVIF